MLEKKLNFSVDSVPSVVPIKQADLPISDYIATIPKGLQAKDIQNMQKNDLLRLQEHMQAGSTWGIAELPKHWFPKSARQMSRLNFYGTFGVAANDTERELAVLTAVRLFLLMLIVPSQTSPRRPASLLAPSTVSGNLHGIIFPLLRKGLTKPEREDGKLLARLDRKEYVRPKGRSADLLANYARLDDYIKRGYWSDTLSDSNADTTSEKTNLGPKQPKKEISPSSFKPLPDALVHGVGKIASWIVLNLTDPVLDTYERVIAGRHVVRDAYQESKPTTIKGAIVKDAERKLLATQWCAINGSPLRLPKELASISFPPKNYLELVDLISLCQRSHFFITSLSAGPRASEILDFNTDVLVEVSNDITVARARTFKIVDAVDGELRDWPLPRLAVEALVKQIRLSKAISNELASRERKPLPDATAVSALWRQTAHQMHFGMEWTSNYNNEMRSFVEILGLSHLLDQQPFTHHRFRKTIARLVALCYAHAPKILMDIFGHRDIDMTLHYILEDPTLLVEIEHIRKEIILMKSIEAVQNIVSYGGPAKHKIEAAVESVRTAKGDFNATDATELASLLTVDGRYWEYVRPGIICTKLQDEVGPCNKGRSAPNPASCNASCAHRLEEAELRAECDATLSDLVNYLHKAWAQNDTIIAEMWSGQIMTQLRRFDSVQAKWKQHPVVERVLAETTKGDFLYD